MQKLQLGFGTGVDELSKAAAHGHSLTKIISAASFETM